ncbi:MAG TPA: hypothetical protein VFV17_09155, partial [Usitatibacteraceae bacterium]|nr:hypothetical protein [Usitatibacteraceae bacterium]
PKPAARGKAAEPVDDAKGNEDDKHLNSIIKLKDGRLLVVGESGTILKSTDAGKTWSAIASPYKGSFFGAIEAEDGAVVIFGLRGKIFRSDASLANLQLVENKSVASIMGATRLADGRLVLAGLAGTVLLSNDQGKSFTKGDTGSTKAYAATVAGAPNAILLVGEAGARDWVLAASPAAAAAAQPAKK